MNATVSTKRRRAYPRKFDWDRARALHAEGLGYRQIATQMGVSYTAVMRVCDPAVNEKMRQYMSDRQRSGTCSACGQPCSLNPDRPAERCRECFDADPPTTTVMPALLRCSKCHLWLPDESFNFDQRRRVRRHRHLWCRLCRNAWKRAYRARLKEKP